MTIAIVSAGACFAVVQTLYPAPFLAFNMVESRGAGFWINPNNCGALCVFTLLITFIWPLAQAKLNLLVRCALLAGIAASSSRAATGSLVLAILIILLVQKNLKTAVWVTVSAALLYVLISSVNLEQIAARLAPNSHRTSSFVRLAGGEATEVVQQDIRWRIWQYSANVAMENWVSGCGLTCMDHVAPFAGHGLGPHNYYIYVLGTAGIVPLVALIFLLFRFCAWAFAVRPALMRGICLAWAVDFAFLLVFDHALPGTQCIAPMFLFFAIYSADSSNLRFRYSAG
jgi:O-antigen ligase